MPTLYRHFDVFHRLLYIGISNSALTRTSQHGRTASWFKDIAYIALEEVPTREEAVQRERIAIINEKPLHNKIHNTGKEPEAVECNLPTYSNINLRLAHGATVYNYCIRNCNELTYWRCELTQEELICLLVGDNPKGFKFTYLTGQLRKALKEIEEKTTVIIAMAHGRQKDKTYRTVFSLAVKE